ncbi:hypothetical protein C8R42DRAFT_643057 [Lentinula raphanica]|nr:hypothetical protein C8R42DRAFT_643057 [Lentinula raphanica]
MTVRWRWTCSSVRQVLSCLLLDAFGLTIWQETLVETSQNHHSTSHAQNERAAVSPPSLHDPGNPETNDTEGDESFEEEDRAVNENFGDHKMAESNTEEDNPESEKGFQSDSGEEEKPFSDSASEQQEESLVGMVGETSNDHIKLNLNAPHIRYFIEELKNGGEVEEFMRNRNFKGQGRNPADKLAVDKYLVNFVNRIKGVIVEGRVINEEERSNLIGRQKAWLSKARKRVLHATGEV